MARMSDEEAFRQARAVMQRNTARPVGDRTEPITPAVVERQPAQVVVHVHQQADPRWTTSSLATQSLVFGCLSLLFSCIPLVPMAAVCMGVMVLRESAVNAERKMAWAGVILGALLGSVWSGWAYLMITVLWTASKR